jgi:hypothetical protein
MALLSHAVGRTERLSVRNEVFALVLLFAGTLLFVALISYTPNDIPSWLWFSHVSPANHPAQNFIGPLGAIVAGICYRWWRFRFAITGSGSARIGAAKLFYPHCVSCRESVDHLFLISGACLGKPDQPFAREGKSGGHSRAGRPHWVSACPMNIAACSCLRTGRYGSSPRRSLFDHADWLRVCARFILFADGQSYSQA